MKDVGFFEPTTLGEAVDLLAEYGKDATPIAGGTDLVNDLRRKLRTVQNLVSLANIQELVYIRANGSIQVGAMTVLNAIDRSAIIRTPYPMISEAAALVGSRQIRNLATMGGNICNAVPSADTAPPLLAADAEILIQGKKGRRQIPLAGFFKGPRRSALEADELLVGFILPPAAPNTGCVYRRQTPRKALDLAMVGVAVSLTLDAPKEKVISARVALGAVAPVPLRVTEAEKILVGTTCSEEVVRAAADLAVVASSPISDGRGSKEQRQEIIRVLTRRCIQEALRRAR